MNLVDGVTTFPVPVRNNASLTRSENTARHMETVCWANLAAVLARNLAMTQSLHVVDVLLLVLHVQEVRNFEWWEHSVAAEEVLTQDRVEEEPSQDCFRMSVAQ